MGLQGPCMSGMDKLLNEPSILILYAQPATLSHEFGAEVVFEVAGMEGWLKTLFWSHLFDSIRLDSAKW